MPNFEPVRKLTVNRTLSDGTVVSVGTLAQNSNGIYFAYDGAYLNRYGNLSPYKLKSDTELQLAPSKPFGGLHGLFADSLPDGWGLLLQDRYFRREGILPNQVTPLDRLAFVGHNAIGALGFEPLYEWEEEPEEIGYARLGLEAQAVFDGQTDDVLLNLIQAGSSGGARPKAQIFMKPGKAEQCRTVAGQGDEAWIVKFTSRSLPLGHEEGLCEAVCLTLAEKAGLQPNAWQLLEAPAKSGAIAWLAVKRFDWRDNAEVAGRYHVHSVSGLLNADFRMPSLDYTDLIKMSKQLCKTPLAGRLAFERAVFNILVCNQDDHAKNWTFIQADNGLWSPAPFYDVTFSPQQFGEHSTAFGGYGKNPPLKTMQNLASLAGYGSWQEAKEVIQKIADCAVDFQKVAHGLGVGKQTTDLIQKHLNRIRLENRDWINS
ncbi:type II toxin-antitoxin system HipA family toxin [Neisseria weixii]|uniref:Type II toxin-antitoxin system HipA family toxin n=1 Tax=Neisseria weixii TaxID=1853276 RepID=A0A3N4MNR9_9NEIS|nr:type II toxin-antitoxin system HipA family toxin [Neisseria weixii]RPD83326.1 type II toxin-antitoxin system HipA family toxin [Neisseria weixii]RPD83732.1 type II toxin-antitoxin system HipA family toxin [Neisseria weixii]